MQDDLAVRSCLILRFRSKMLAQDPVVVDFAIDCQNDRSIFIGQWLGSTVCTILSIISQTRLL